MLLIHFMKSRWKIESKPNPNSSTGATAREMRSYNGGNVFYVSHNKQMVFRIKNIIRR